MKPKRFKFRLERVLNFRDSEKKERERALAEQNAELRKREDHLEAIIVAQDEMKLPESEILSMAELQLAGEYQQALREALIEQRLLIIEATQAVEQAREAYLEKNKEVRTLESLKDRRKEEFREELRKDEKKNLDEHAIQKVGRKQR